MYERTWRQHTDLHRGGQTQHIPEHLRQRFLIESAKASTGYKNKMSYALALIKAQRNQPQTVQRGLRHADE